MGRKYFFTPLILVDMKTLLKVLIVAMVIFVPIYAFGFGPSTGGGIQLTAEIISIVNFILLITSLISIKQLILPKQYEDETGDYNRTPFHIFNIVFATVFYDLSIRFLLNHKAYYQGYEKMNNVDCIKTYFFAPEMFSIMQIIILVGVVVNFIYILTHIHDYYYGTTE